MYLKMNTGLNWQHTINILSAGCGNTGTGRIQGIIQICEKTKYHQINFKIGGKMFIINPNKDMRKLQIETKSAISYEFRYRRAGNRNGALTVPWYWYNKTRKFRDIGSSDLHKQALSAGRSPRKTPTKKQW